MTILVNWAKEVLRISSISFIVFMVLIGAALVLIRPRWGRRWVIGFAIAFWFCSTPLGSGLLAGSLARGFHPLEDRREADGVAAIVVLGGGTKDVTAGPVRLGYPIDETALRIVEAVRVFQLLGSQLLIVASGGSPRTDQGVPEAEVIAAGLAQLHVPPDHVLVDSRSETTREQAVAVTRLLGARGIRRFVLVTSPTHMLRAVLVFRAQGADVVPSMSPLRSTAMTNGRFFMPNGGSLQLSDDAVYDYAEYRLLLGARLVSPRAGRVDQMKVLVLGASGHLGAAISHEFRRDSSVVALDHGTLDITDDARVRARVAAEAPDVIVNCAAYNFVDDAEEHPVEALNVNAFGVRALACAAAECEATLVHYSTDFVFDGRTDRPYTELNRTNPQSVYAGSKLLGEWFAADAPRHYVLRVESLFGRAPNGPERGSATAILQRLRSGDEVRVFVDRTVSPTHVIDAAAATRAVIERTLQPGLYHCVNSGHCTWREFAEEAARLMGREPRLVAITVDDVPTRAKRPKFCALDNAKLASLGVSLPDWRDALRRSLEIQSTGRT